MPSVVLLPAVTPLPRTDGTPWVSVDVLENTTPNGTYIAIQSFVLDPVDTDPSEPLARTITTNEATAIDGYYRLRFVDADTNTWTSGNLRPASGVTTNNWFTLEDLQQQYPNYPKIQTANAGIVDTVDIPAIQNWLLNYVGPAYDETLHKATLITIAKSYLFRRLLADDNAIQIARARGQTSLTVAGETINIDLSKGGNFWLTEEEQEILKEMRGPDLSDIHTDKAAVRGDALYVERNQGLGHTEYVQDDHPADRPGYISGRI